MLRLLVDTTHPLGFGMREVEAGYFAGSPAFRTRVPDARFDRRVVARYPDHRDDIPVSGYIAGAKLLERQAAVVEVEVGKGQVVLIGFRAQHRAQPHRTFKLLFNSLFLAGARRSDALADRSVGAAGEGNRSSAGPANYCQSGAQKPPKPLSHWEKMWLARFLLFYRR